MVQVLSRGASARSICWQLRSALARCVTGHFPSDFSQVNNYLLGFSRSGGPTWIQEMALQSLSNLQKWAELSFSPAHTQQLPDLSK